MIKKAIQLAFLGAIVLLFSFSALAQKVGLVLSGGGARGLAHVGVLKALEEKKVPIDYIAGTSSGALIGAMYAIGMTPEQIEDYVRTPDFQRGANGDVDENLYYYFKRRDNDASCIGVRFSLDSILSTSLPTSIYDPRSIDFELLKYTSGPIAAANYNFDSLFIPFRCVAADIHSKETIVFKKGQLGMAVRASIAIPFYYPGIMHDGRLLFDGGLYNNFPADAILKDFAPDVVIGCVVSGNEPIPEEDDFVSQLRNMVANNTNYTVLAKSGILLNPDLTGLDAFDFDRVTEMVEAGYNETIKKLDQIKALIPTERDSATVEARRRIYHHSINKYKIMDVRCEGVNTHQEDYIQRSINPWHKPLTLQEFKLNYYKIANEENVRRVFPELVYNKVSGYYDAVLHIKRAKNMNIKFGGNFASRPINGAFIALNYTIWDRQMTTISLNAYYGKLYSSVQAKLRYEFVGRVPFYLDPEFTLSQYDFFRSASAFFEEKKPSYIVQNEGFVSLKAAIPVNYKSKLTLGTTFFTLKDNYYQTSDFTVADTFDVTRFSGFSTSLTIDRNNLNRKMYANSGTSAFLRLRHTNAKEAYDPGTRSASTFPEDHIHNWLSMKGQVYTYVPTYGLYTPGFMVEGVISNQKTFSNYTSSLLSAPAFLPLVDSRTVFIPEFRAYSYIGIGSINIFRIFKQFDLRLEAYILQPYRVLLRTAENNTSFGKPFAKRFPILNSSVVYQTPIGPVSLSVNYYNERQEKFSVLFHFGYLLFNRRALE